MSERSTHALHIRPKEICSYELDFQIPPKTSIHENISRFPSTSFSVTEHKFKTGILSKIEHPLRFTLNSTEVKVNFLLPKPNHLRDYFIDSADMQLLQKRVVNYTRPVEFQNKWPNDQSVYCLWEATCINADLPWTDSIDTIRISLNIGRATVGSFKSLECLSSTNGSSENVDRELNPAPFYLSSQFSDLKILCGEQEFLVHRIILACVSSVFAAMFDHKMQESENGILVIEDIERNVVEEMLRFVYTGKVENIQKVAQPLLITAEKYNLPGLKSLCEEQLVQQVTTENALEMYEFSDIFCSSLIKDKVVEIFKRNKSTVVPDSTKFKEFVCKYPELMFDLFKLSN